MGNPDEPTMGRLLFDSMLGILSALGLVLATNAIFVGDWIFFSVSIAGCIVTGAWLLKRIFGGSGPAEPNLKPELKPIK